MSNVGIFWAVVDSLTQEWLKEQARYKNVHAHHITLRFNVAYEKYQYWEGREFELSIPSIEWNYQVQAARVVLPPEISPLCNNDHPHITISTEKGVSPVESNRMLVKPEGRNILDSPIKAKAEIKFFEFNG